VPLRIARGRRLEEVDAAWLADTAAAHRRVSIDVGAGDGRYVLQRATAEPGELVIAMDASHAGLRESSARAARDPKRGGLPNALFVVAALEAAPAELLGLGSMVTVHFPWGTLLDAAIGREAAGTRRLAGLVASGGWLRLLVSAHQRDERQGAVSLDPYSIVDAYRSLGFEPLEVRPATVDDAVAARSSWGKRLLGGSHGRGAATGRDTWLLELRHVESARG
jgi:16S rRNA (adenine(1408)-N(1))-methyltransferase